MHSLIPIHMIPRILFLLLCLPYGPGLFAQPTEGIFKMGVISFGIIDSLLAENPKMEKMLSERKKSIEYDLHFTPESSMSVYTSPAKTKRLIFHKQSRVVITTLETKDEKWYSVDSLGLYLDSELVRHMDSLANTKEIRDSMKKIFQVSDSPEDQKNIFGFPCTKVTLVDRHKPGTIESISYCTDRIPTAAMLGPLSKFIPGMALESTMYVDGQTIITGAIAFTSQSIIEELFGIDLRQFKQVSSEELDELSSNLDE